MRKNLFNLLWCCLFPVCAVAQTDGYKFYSRLDSVKRPGFYNIELTPELNALVKTDLSDLRIINEQGKWIPHLVHTAAEESAVKPELRKLKFSLTAYSGIYTEILIESSKQVSTNIGLLITNTAAERYATLSGSNDRSGWFVINDSILLNPVPAPQKTETIFRIDFPPNNYSFYRIVIHNDKKDPLQIKDVVEYTNAPGMSNPLFRLIENPAPVLTQKDSGKISYIKIGQQKPYPFDHISLRVNGVTFFNRKAGIYIPYGANSSFENPGQLLQSITISNNSTLQYRLPLTASVVCYLLINNEDNLPLQVQEIKTAVSNRYITTYLDSGSTYKLIMHNETAVLPNYDLDRINSPVPDSIAFLQFSDIRAFPANVQPAVTAKTDQWILWSAVAAALIMLLFFTFKMIKAVDKKKSHDRL